MQNDPVSAHQAVHDGLGQRMPQLPPHVRHVRRSVRAYGAQRRLTFRAVLHSFGYGEPPQRQHRRPLQSGYKQCFSGSNAGLCSRRHNSMCDIHRKATRTAPRQNLKQGAPWCQHCLTPARQRCTRSFAVVRR